MGAGRRKTKHGNSHVRHGGLLDIPAARQDSDMALSRPCLSRGASVPDQVSPLPASSSSSPSTITSLPSSQDRSSSDAVTQTCSMRPAEAVRKHHIPGIALSFCIFMSSLLYSHMRLLVVLIIVAGS